MRIARLDLTRYGRFTDRTLDLPSGKVDLHLVVGRNEAGKSTTRAGLSELLFGIDTRTPYAFVHDYQSMRIGAVLERGDRRLVVQRRKGNKNTLLDEGGQPLGDGALAPFLGAADRAFFERMFSLDLQALAEGGRQLLDAKDDIGRMLFQASGGLARFGEVLDELDRELEQLWAPRRSGTRAYYTAHDQLEAADRSFKEGVVRVNDFQRAEAAVDDARARVDEAARRHAELVRERSRLERIKRVSPALARRSKLLDDLAALGEVPLLPSSATRDLQDATSRLALADADLERLARDIAEAAATRDAAIVDDKLLSLAADIRAAGDRRQQLKNHPGEIGNCITEVQLLTGEAEDVAARLGWVRAPLEDLRARMPSELAQQELARLIARHDKLLRDRDAAARALADKLAERDRLASDRDPARDDGPPDPLVDALERARKLGDADRARQRLAEPAKTLAKNVDAARKQLAPWTGDIEALRAVVPPPDEELEAIATRLARIEHAHEQARSERSKAISDLDRRRLEERQVRRDAHPVTADELANARAARDERLQSLADATPTRADVDELSRLVAEADALADRRFDAAEASVRLQKIRADIELGEQRLASLDASLRDHDDAREDARRALVALQAGVGIALDTPAALRAWVRARAHVLELAAQAERAAHELEQHDAEVAAATEELRATLTAIGAVTEGRTFAGLVRLATESVTELEGARLRQAQLVEQLADIDRVVPDLERARDGAERAIEEWRIAFATQVAELGLGRVKEPEVAASALSLLHELGAKLAEIELIETRRIGAMRRELTAFAGEVGRLALAVAPELATRDAMELVPELVQRVARAEEAQRTHLAAANEVAAGEAAQHEARAARAQAEARLRPLLEAAGVTELSALHAAVERSDRRRKLEDDLRSAEQHLVEIGDGRSLDELEAEAGSEPDAAVIDDRLATVDADLHALTQTQKELAVTLADARRAYEKIAGQADAATAASQRSEAVAKMSEAIERYVRVKTARELLRWAIERYRREKQGPLLARASELFATLTLGELERLVVEYDDKDQPRLAGVRRNGSTVSVDGMSTGTADQLFLSLRVAALEKHLEGSAPLPFVADDLLAHFDDQRAGAAFRVLAELARRTQVLFFTHHEHLVGVARDALGDAFHVARL